MYSNITLLRCSKYRGYILLTEAITIFFCFEAFTSFFDGFFFVFRAEKMIGHKKTDRKKIISTTLQNCLVQIPEP